MTAAFIISFVLICFVEKFAMSGENNSDSSTSESEVSACSSNFNPLKALYSKKTKVPVTNAPLYENISHFESAQKSTSEGKVIPVGKRDLIKKREEEKEKKKREEEKQLLEKNKQRFAQYRGKEFEVMF